jgi:hypothetical protein
MSDKSRVILKTAQTKPEKILKNDSIDSANRFSTGTGGGGLCSLQKDPTDQAEYTAGSGCRSE